MRKEGIPPFEKTWMDLEYLMLSERRQRKTSTFMWNLKKKVQVIKGRLQNGCYQGVENQEIELRVFKDIHLERKTKKP